MYGGVGEEEEVEGEGEEEVEGGKKVRVANLPLELCTFTEKNR